MDFIDSSSPRSQAPAQVPPSDCFGKSTRIAQACIDGATRLRHIREASTSNRSQTTTASDSSQAHPKSLKQLSRQLHVVSAEIDTHRAALIELLVQFDDQRGWESLGARNCAEWANAELGIAKASAYEFLRVGRELRELPIISALFCGGELSWSKVRFLVRVADEDNERDLAHVSLDATVEDVRRICNEFRWKKREQQPTNSDDSRSAEEIAADENFQNRSLVWRELADGCIEFRLCVPSEKAQAIIKSLEHCENELYENLSANKDQLPADENKVSEARPTISQRRADAIELMAERSLALAGRDVSRADRYQVVLHVDKKDFMNGAEKDLLQWPNAQEASTIHTERFPNKRPWIEGTGALAQSVARRLSCDAVIVGLLHEDGEPLSIGRKTRTWPTAIWRAVVSRDRHCQFPGCNEHKHLEVHHIRHWADGGETSVENGLCLCRRHHTLVHEGGYQIQRNIVATITQPGPDYGLTTGLVSSSKKALLPGRQRFRFIKPVADLYTGPVSHPVKPVHESCGCKETSATYSAGYSWRNRNRTLGNRTLGNRTTTNTTKSTQTFCATI